MNDRDGLYKLDVSYACKMVLEMVLDVRSVLPFELREIFYVCSYRICQKQTYSQIMMLLRLKAPYLVFPVMGTHFHSKVYSLFHNLMVILSLIPFQLSIHPETPPLISLAMEVWHWLTHLYSKVYSLFHNLTYPISALYPPGDPTPYPPGNGGVALAYPPLQQGTHFIP